QMDLYHAQIMGGDLAERTRQLWPLIRHFQIAGVPGRHEPDVGEINYPFLFDLIDSLGYDGWIGCEYRPRGKTLDGIGWAKRYGIGGEPPGKKKSGEHENSHHPGGGVHLAAAGGASPGAGRTSPPPPHTPPPPP